jgi:hypothetical protein
MIIMESLTFGSQIFRYGFFHEIHDAHSGTGSYFRMQA